jgi:hypothetical protein
MLVGGHRTLLAFWGCLGLEKACEEKGKIGTVSGAFSRSFTLYGNPEAFISSSGRTVIVHDTGYGLYAVTAEPGKPFTSPRRFATRLPHYFQLRAEQQEKPPLPTSPNGHAIPTSRTTKMNNISLGTRHRAYICTDGGGGRAGARDAARHGGLASRTCPRARAPAVGRPDLRSHRRASASDTPRRISQPSRPRPLPQWLTVETRAASTASSSASLTQSSIRTYVDEQTGEQLRISPVFRARSPAQAPHAPELDR